MEFTNPEKNQKKINKVAKFTQSSGSGCVCIFENVLQITEKLQKLLGQGFNMKRISILGEDYINEAEKLDCTERESCWRNCGFFWCDILTQREAPSLLFVHGIGPIFVSGDFGDTLRLHNDRHLVPPFTTSLGPVISLIGVSDEKIKIYEKTLKSGNYIVLALEMDEREESIFKDVMNQSSK